jgi:NitT/TauT family transport system permease protein
VAGLERRVAVAKPPHTASTAVEDAPGRGPLLRVSLPTGRRRTRRRKLRIFGSLKTRHRVGVTVLSFVFLLGLWWLAATINLASDVFLPSPYQVGTRLVELAKQGTLWTDMKASVLRITIGFLISTALAVPIGALIGIYRGVEAAVEPPISFIRYMPAVAFVPLTIVWVGLGEEQKYLMVFIGTFFQQVLLFQDNVRRVPREYVDIGYTLGLSEPRIIGRIVLPAAAPAMWDTLRITLGWAWTYLVVAELVAASSGLGYRSLVAQRFFETDVIFVVVLVIGVIGLVMDQVLRIIGSQLFRWAGTGRA